MKLNFKTLCACLALIYGNCFGNVGIMKKSQSLSDISALSKSNESTNHKKNKEEQYNAKCENYEKEVIKLTKEKEELQAELSKALSKNDKLLNEMFHENNTVSDLTKQIKQLKNKCKKYLDDIITLNDINDGLNSRLLRAEEIADINEENAEKYWFELVKLDDYKAIEKFIKYGINVNSRNVEGDTALILAIDDGYDDLVKLLLKQEKIDVNLSNSSRRTPLLAAVQKKNLNVINKLIEKEVSITEEALFNAVALQNAEIVKLLLKNYKTPNRKQTMERLIEMATDYDSEEIVNLLKKEVPEA